jgi:hypothetical protein
MYLGEVFIMKIIVLTSMVTILGGVTIFVLGQIILKFYIEPIQQFRLHIGKITDALIFYANLYSNPGTNVKEQVKEASNEIRKLASELISTSAVVPLYRTWSSLKIIPKLKNIKEARSNLIGLSNSLFSSQNNSQESKFNRERVEKIITTLNLPPELLS